MTEQLNSPPAFQDHLQASPLAAVYFSGPDCGVCSVLKPKLLALFSSEFPDLSVAEVDCARQPELSASQSVFTIPTLLIYIDGREAFRFARSFSPAQVRDSLQRPYGLFTGE